MEASNNLSVILYGPKDVRIEPKKVEELKDDEVLIEVKCAGICGTDVHVWQMGGFGSYSLKEPMTLGHESSGQVVRVGSEVKKLKVGDRVAIEPGVSCRRCSFCKRGKGNLCPDVAYCATPPHDGSLSQYFKHPADYCLKLPDKVSYEEGAVLQPLAVVLYACQRAKIAAGDRVLILGAGPIGILTLLTVKAMGASHIIITDINAERLRLAKELGADLTVMVDTADVDQIVRRMREECGGQLPEKTMECCGVESSIQLGIKATESGGNFVLVGLGRPSMNVPLMEAAIREINIIGVFRYGNCYPKALSLIASGKIDVKSLITHNYDLKDSVKALEAAKSGKGIKIIIHCNK